MELKPTHTPTQPLANKAMIAGNDPAYCASCGLFFNWGLQTKHGGCPECNFDRWVRGDEIRRAVNSHEALLEAAKDALCWLDPDCKLDGIRANEDMSEREKMVVNLYEAIAQAEVNLP